MEPKDSNENLAWLSAAMTQSHTEGVATGARLFALFYRQLTADGVPDESAMMLTEAFMIWQLDHAAEAGQR